MKRILVGLLCALVSAQTFGIDGEYSKATKLGKPQTKVMGCPDGSFWDPRNGGECWTCGDNKRSVERVDGKRACIVTPKTSFARAKRHERNKTKCTGTAFFDIGTASCWSCPDNYKRTVFSIRKGKACERRFSKRMAKATYSHTVKTLTHSCGKGHFANVGSRKCYECKSGWKHDASKTVGKNGVCYKPARVAHAGASLVSKPSLKCSKGFYDMMDGGSCWTCPSGFKRHVTSVKDAKACIAVSAPGFAPARFVSARAPKSIDIAKGVSNLGCGGYGKGAFFDLKDGGSCWACSEPHSRRTLYAVNSSKACATQTCGKEGGRPCLLWERVPSCNKGLAEDFVHNQCRQPTNLACKTFVRTLASLKRAVDKANATGEALTEKALDAVPGQKALMEAMARKAQEVQEEAAMVAKKIPLDDVLEPMTAFLAENQDKVEIVANMASHAQSTRRDLENVLLDADLICSGSSDRIANRLESLGFASMAKPKRRTTINMAARPRAVGVMSFAAAANPVVQLLAANDGVLRHHRIAFDIGVSLPAEKLVGSFKNFKAPLTLGIQISTNFNGDVGVYFMHGLGFGASAENTFQHANLVSELVGTTALSVGFQYNGRSPDTCKSSSSYAWGVPVKITDWVGIGVRPNCRARWSGFTLNLPTGRKGVDIGELAKKILYVSSLPSGSASIAGPSSTTRMKYSVGWPEVKSLGAGYEGGLKLSGNGIAGIF